MLTLLSWLFGRVIQVRNRLYTTGLFKIRDLPARTIAVGNITVGGTGKTPLVAYIAETLFRNGESVCIISRGYKRNDESSRVLVSDGTAITADWRQAGDEPLELALRLIGKASVVCDRNRVAAAKWVFDKLNPTVFILDDAFQHRRAKRDIDIAVVDATNPFGNGILVPGGILREDPRNLSRADIIVLNRVDLCTDPEDVERKIRKYAPDVPVFRASGEFARFVTLADFTVGDSGESAEPTEPVFAFCGLGNPHNFFGQIESAGFRIAGKRAFPDHHKYSAEDIDRVVNEAKSCGAASVLTTAKDAVKLETNDSALHFLVCENIIKFENEKGFADLISKA